MSQLVDILEHSALLGGGAVLCYLVIWWKRRNQQKARTIEAEGLQAKAHKEAENVLRDARLTAEEEARAEYLKKVEQEADRDAAGLTRRILEEAKAKADEKARQIISVAIQRYAGEHTFETTTATVALQGDEVKGRIIGREGRNIRAFEAATGVTVLIDDTPGAVLLSGFDPVRRGNSRGAMETPLPDGRIHPPRTQGVGGQGN